LPGCCGYVELGESQGDLLLDDIATDGTYVYWANGDQLVRAKADTKGNLNVSKTFKSEAILRSRSAPRTSTSPAKRAGS